MLEFTCQVEQAGSQKTRGCLTLHRVRRNSSCCIFLSIFLNIFFVLKKKKKVSSPECTVQFQYRNLSRKTVELQAGLMCSTVKVTLLVQVARRECVRFLSVVPIPESILSVIHFGSMHTQMCLCFLFSFTKRKQS